MGSRQAREADEEEFAERGGSGSAKGSWVLVFRGAMGQKAQRMAESSDLPHLLLQQCPWWEP